MPIRVEPHDLLECWLVAIVFEGVAVGVGEIDCVFAASSFDLDIVFLKFLLQVCQSGFCRLEAEVLQRIVGRDPFLGADEIDQVLTRRRAKKNHVGWHTKGNLQPENLRIKPFGLFEIAGQQRNM